MDTLPAAPGLLGHAVSYALASAGLATPQLLPRATPCEGWDLRTLLLHVSDSLGVLAEAMRAGRVGPGPPPAHEPAAGADPVGCLRRRARNLLGACAAAGSEERLVAIADRELTASMVTAAGAIEIAVHGWDISAACGLPRPIPPGLAAELLPLAPLLIPHATRAGLFAEPVPVPEPACPGDRLVAFLGRRPWPDSSA
ncbi:MAG TPA: TIGR03086 family metal-binding protein [Streptosporangiaceae bacterium]|jgi:uncharacterized protein (TIGR03086 family)